MTFKIELRPFEPEHIIKTYEWVCTPRIQKMFLMREKPTCEGHITYWEKTLSDQSQHVYAIYADSAHIGNCGLKNKGELWIYIGFPEFLGHGIGSTATSMLLELDKVFNETEMACVHVAKFNKIAIKMYKRLGFKEVDWLEDEWQGRGVIRMELR